MKKINFLLAGFVMFSLFIYGCNPENKTDTKKILPGKWMLKTLNGKEVVKEKTGGAMPYLNFDLTANSVSGNTGCNDLGGKINISETEMTFSDMSMSKIYCSGAEYEYEIVGLLFHSKPIIFKFDNDILTFTRDDKMVMTLKKEIKNTSIKWTDYYNDTIMK